MSALARYFKFINKEVAGYDRINSSITDQLESEGITVTTNNSEDTLPLAFRNAGPEKVLVIYTAAIRGAHAQLDWFKENGHVPLKRAEVLGKIATDYQLIAVGGTHGKTTTSCLLTHILSNSEIKFLAILGGISTDLESNFYVNGIEPRYMVTEADEYDGSFHHLDPEITILTSTDADHLDFYKSKQNIRSAYHQFAASTKRDGLLVCQKDTGMTSKGINSTSITYGISDGDARAWKIRVEDGKFYFTYEDDKTRIENLHLGVRGIHNVENAVAAIAVSLHLGIGPETIEKSLASFKGVKRRFEYILDRDDIIYIDDYAHHPTEIMSTIASVKELYPGKKITGVFQPHLYSRTKDFADEFAKSLSMLDEPLLMPIYPAREEPVPGVTSEMIKNKMTGKETNILTSSEVIEHIRKKRPEVLITMGAGDIDRIVEPLKQVLQ